MVEFGKDGEVYLSVSPGHAKFWSGEDIQKREERDWSMENDIAGNGWYEKENEERS